jgi:RNA polymerase sigma-70 factor, ECF subfamily
MPVLVVFDTNIEAHYDLYSKIHLMWIRMRHFWSQANQQIQAQRCERAADIWGDYEVDFLPFRPGEASLGSFTFVRVGHGVEPSRAESGRRPDLARQPLSRAAMLSRCIRSFILLICEHRKRGAPNRVVTRVTDEEIMQSLSGGDLEAFNELVLRYQFSAWRMAYRFLRDSMEAEDVAQEAFLKLLKAAPRYKPTAPFRSYFYRVLMSLCIDRARKRHPAAGGAEEAMEVPDPSLSPPEALVEKERAAHVHAALDGLPPNQKAALILKHYEGLSYVEIAQVLNISPKAVERLISRARTSLQTRLAHLRTH